MNKLREVGEGGEESKREKGRKWRERGKGKGEGGEERERVGKTASH